jgi:protein O-GlcNAc transferase
VKTLSPSAGAALEQAAALAREGRIPEATSVLDSVAVAHETDAGFADATSRFWRRHRRFGDALLAARRAVALDPADADHQCVLGLCLIDAREPAAAEASLRRAIEIDRSLAEAHNALAILACRKHDYSSAEAHWIEAIEAEPGDTGALCNLAHMLRSTGRGDEAAALMAPAAQSLVHDVAVQWSMAVAANYDPTMTPEQVVEHHRAHGRALLAKRPPTVLRSNDTPRRPRVAGEPLRVGFLSPDLREHSVASFLLPLLASLDRARVRPWAFMTTAHSDAVTDRFRAVVSDFVPCGELSDLELVQRVRAERLDILVECAGLFEGSRPAALTWRMAPVQVTWLGYPNTTGLPNVDVRLVDAETDPPGADSLATERLERMAGGFVCWRSLHAVPLPERDPYRPVTFGCFNAMSKFHGDLYALWARVLAGVPGSRLLLKAAPLADPGIADLLRAQFADHGIAADRLDLRGHTDSQSDHLAMYGDVDIALDTFPYNGTTTTCEALWMGTPVVALTGRGHPARVGHALLAAAGLGEWVAATADEYIDLAVRLATDRDRLAIHHRTLRDRLERSPICDAVGFARRFEDALERLIA